MAVASDQRTEAYSGSPIHDRDNYLGFTLLFEETIMFIGPMSLTILAAAIKLPYLLREPRMVRSGGLLWRKMLGHATMAILQLMLVIATSTHTAKLTPASVPASLLGLIGSILVAVYSFVAHQRQPRPSTILNVYLIATVPMDGLRIRTLTRTPHAAAHTIILAAYVACKSVVFIFEATKKTAYLLPSSGVYSPEETSGIWSRATLWWLMPLLLTGYKVSLDLQHLFNIDDSLQSPKLLTDQYRDDIDAVRHIPQQFRKRAPTSLMKRLGLRHLHAFLVPMFPRVFSIGFKFAQPFLIERTSQYVTSTEASGSPGFGGSLVVTYFLVYVGIAISNALYRQKAARAMTAVRADLVVVIYRHLLVTDHSATSKAGTTTLMSADVELVQQAMRNMHELWACVIEAVLAIVILARLLRIGAASSAGVALACVLLNVKVAAKAGLRQKKWLQRIESRLSKTSSFLACLKSVKMAGGSMYVIDSLRGSREDEIQTSQRFRRLLIAVVSASFALYIMTPVFGFGTYSLAASAGGTLTLTSVTAFTSLSAFTLLCNALDLWTNTLFSVAAGVGSFSRIESFLHSQSRVDGRAVVESCSTTQQLMVRDGDQCSEDGSRSSTSSMSTDSSAQVLLQPEQQRHRHSNSVEPVDSSVAIKLNQVCARWSPQSPPVFQDLDLVVNMGTFLVIVGGAGCGKTTLIQTMLGEIGHLTGLAYVRPARIAYCSQTPWLPNDTIRNIVVPTGLFSQDWYDTVMRACALTTDFSEFQYGDETVVGSNGCRLSGGQRARLALARGVYARPQLLLLDDTLCSLDTKTIKSVLYDLFGPSGILRSLGTTVILTTAYMSNVQDADAFLCMDDTGNLKRSETTLANIRNCPNNPKEGFVANSPRASDYSEDETFNGGVIVERSNTIDSNSRKHHATDFEAYRYYFRHIKSRHLLIFGLMVAGFEFTYLFPQIWLEWWTDAIARGDTGDLDHWLGIYFSFGVVCLALWVSATVYYALFIAPQVARTLHEVLTKKVLTAPLSWTVAADIGNLLNRFSQDLQLIDMELPLAMIGTTRSLASCLGQCILISVGSFYSAIAIPMVVGLIAYLQKFYLRTSRRLRILEIESKAPLFSHFLESIDGLITIRAFGWQDMHAKKNIAAMRASQTPFYLLLCAQVWLNLALDLIMATLAVGVAGITVAAKGKPAGVSVGMALFNILGFSGMTKLLAMQWTSLEICLGAVERIRQVDIDTPSEDCRGQIMRPTWPDRGDISFRDVCAIYSRGRASVLLNVSLHVAAGQHCAIVGRTGSGKTTMISALLRMLEIQIGCIQIDGLDVSQVATEDIRSRITVLPQDPLLLQASVRENMRLGKRYTDDEIISVLEEFDLWTTIQEQGGLDVILTEKVLSHGQRHLLAFARAILTSSRVILLDEISSQVDVATVRKMVAAVKQHFTGKTVINVAHKLDTIIDYDLVAVMESGRLVEVGHPRSLMRGGGQFAEMCRYQGLS